LRSTSSTDENSLDLRFHVRSDATELVISRADDPWFRRWVETGVLQWMKTIAEHLDGLSADLSNAKPWCCPIICSGRGSSIIPAGTCTEQKEKNEYEEMSDHDRVGDIYRCSDARAGAI
jgi:hypothetical protein